MLNPKIKKVACNRMAGGLMRALLELLASDDLTAGMWDAAVECIREWLGDVYPTVGARLGIANPTTLDLPDEVAVALAIYVADTAHKLADLTDQERLTLAGLDEALMDQLSVILELE